MRHLMHLLTVLALALAMSCAANANAEDKADDEKEVTVKFEDLPQVVQTTFKEEARGATRIAEPFPSEPVPPNIRGATSCHGSPA